MKRAIKWAATHEPLILAGVILAAAIFLVLRYGTNADGTTQGLSASTVTLVAGFISRFVTSPAGRKALAAGVDNLPQLEKDVAELQGLFAPAFKQGGGLKGVAAWLADLFANHQDAVEQTIADGISHLQAIADSAAPNVPAAPEPAPAVVEPAPEPAPAPAPAEPAAEPDPIAALAVFAAS